MSQRKRKAQSPGRNGRPAKSRLLGEPLSAAEPTAPARPMPPSDGWRRGLLAATVALFIARPLFPSEAIAQSGEGTPLVMLALLLLVVWGITIIRQGRWTLRFGPADVAVLALLAIHSAAALWATHTGNARATLNVLWAWVGLGVAFFLLRQLVRPGREARAVVAVMIALAVALSSYGFYQYAVELPELRRNYQRDPEGMMRADGIWYEPGTIARAQFDQRLASREPFATFSLTNSLAGYLAPWLVLAVGLAALNGASSAEGGRSRGKMSRSEDHAHASVGMAPAKSDLAPAAVVITILVGACLLLTKSRSALLATVIGLALVALLRFVGHRRIGWRLPVVGGAMAMALVAGAVAVGGLDREVLSEAGKSLGYRLQYWQSTLAMIADHPWVGCGPGQFQNVYPAYKLPEASEEIADPHNFLLEVTATTGVAGGVAILAVLAAFGWSLGKGGAHKCATGSASVSARECATGSANASAPWNSASVPSPDSVPTPDATRWIYAGALAGFLLAWPMGMLGTTAPGMAMLLLGLPLAVVTLWLLADWVNAGWLPTSLLAVALVVLLINLLAAGGIGFPGVAGTFWLLLALGLSASGEKPRGPFPRPVAWVAALLAAVLAGACYWTTYKPVLSARGWMVAAVFDPIERPAHLRAAAQADPLGPDYPRQLALFALAEWRADHDPKSLDEFDRHTAQAVTLDPASNSLWATLGDQRLEIHEYTSSTDQLASAIEAYRRAIALYPNKAEYHAKLALALAQDGQKTAARDEAQAAYRLDEQMPHADKKLPANLRDRLLRNGLGP